ncbi:MAG: FecR domain-containing protein [Calditrichaeota bacterium]|nr:FecR domain-containing protein [Calditrichota bacterium]
MKTYSKEFLLTILFWAIIFNIPAQAQITKDVAIVLKTSGDVRVKKVITKKWYYGKRGVRLDSGDIIKTADNSLAAIMFTDDKSLIKIRDKSMVAIRGKREKNSITKRVLCSLGKFWIKVSKQRAKFVVETPSGIAAVKGTEFYGVVGEDGSTTIIAVEGIVELMNELGKILVRAGESGKLTKNGKPIKYDTPDDQKPDWGGGDENDQELKLEFKDDDGNSKTLRIKYKKKS